MAGETKEGGAILISSKQTFVRSQQLHARQTDRSGLDDAAVGAAAGDAVMMFMFGKRALA